MSTMQTLVCQQPEKLIWQIRDIPTVGDNDVLIKIKRVGICGTDIHAWRGHQPFFSYPRVLGHEICGQVVKTGKNIDRFSSGQQVTVIPYISCQTCTACRDGRENCCENISVIGVHQDGGFSEYLIVPERNLLNAEGLDADAAALIEPFAISAHAVRRAMIQAGEDVMVVGAGPIGLGVAAIAKAKGANVLVADTQSTRREHVEHSLGLPTSDPSAADFPTRIAEHFSGHLALKVIDATGNQQAMNRTVNYIRHGGTIVFVGLFKGDIQFSDTEFHKKETSLLGSRNANMEDFAEVRRLMADGSLNATMMLTHRYPFVELDSLYEQGVINNSDLIKGVIYF